MWGTLECDDKSAAIKAFHFFTDLKKGLIKARVEYRDTADRLFDVEHPKFKVFFRIPKRFALVGMFVCSIVLVQSGFAHHNYRGNFDSDVRIELVGTVVEYKPAYPHTHIVLKVVDASENHSLWTLETHSPNLLERFDWDEDTFALGDRLSVVGSPSRSAGNYLRLHDVTFSDGESVRLQKH